MNETKKTRILTVLAGGVMLGLTVLMVIDLLPLLRQVAANRGDKSAIAQYISSYGFKGVPILMGLQALQIMVAVVPSAAIQVLTGLCYGVWWGTLINLAGCVLGNVMVFVAVRQLRSIVAPMREKLRRRRDSDVFSLAKLKRLKRPELVAFAFFLIPGIPNGIMPYMFAETDITLPRYIAAVVAGSIPSTFLCTYLGERLSRGSYHMALIIAAIAAVVVAVVLMFKDKLVARIERESVPEESLPEEPAAKRPDLPEGPAPSDGQPLSAEPEDPAPPGGTDGKK